MKKYQVVFETHCQITVTVEAENEDQALDLASEVNIVNYGSKSGMGTSTSIEGEDNSYYIDSDNLYDKMESVTEIN